MTKDDIIKLPDKRLRQKSQRIAVIDAQIKQLAADMAGATLDWEASRHHEFGAALAAIQVAQPRRVIVIREDFENKHNTNFVAFINPEIIKTEGQPVDDMEGCLSVEGIYGSVARYPTVKIKALNLDGQEVRLTARGFLARVFQHEIDHTNGILFVDRVPKAEQLYKLADNGDFVPAKL